MGSCFSKWNNKPNTGKIHNSNPDINELKYCKQPGDSSHESCSLSATQKTMKACTKEMEILPILKHRSLSIAKLIAIKNEQTLSFEEFCKPTYIRDHTECKETFRAIETEGK